MRITGITLDAVATTPEFKPGTIGVDDANKAYKYVQYDTGAGAVAAVVGQVAYYYTLNGYKNHQVTSDLSDAAGGAGTELGAGVIMGAPTDGQYCWIQIKGPATLTIALTAGADGDPLTATGATDGTLDVNVATAANTRVCAHAGDISALEIVCEFPE